MQAIKITDKVYWVGAIDWNIRDFHGYSTDKGTTYNAFLILDEKVILIDTVKKEFFDEMMLRIKSVIDPSKIDIIVSNHSELDHSGALLQTISACKPSKIYASVMGAQNLKENLVQDLPVEAVGNGSEIIIGKDKLKFVESRMLHWPDSMIALLEEENVLFCNDIFGMHFASTERFDDELEENTWLYQAKKYYANIILPYSKIVTSFLAQVKKLGINPKIICPDHGLIWRKNPARIVELYADWAAQKSIKKALVVYDTMWGSCNKMAASITDGLKSAGVTVKQMSLHFSHRSDVVAELLDSDALIMGTPVLNQEIYPSLADLLCYLKGLRKQGLKGGVFGSYGWSDFPLNKFEEDVKNIGVEIVAPLVKSKFVPTENVLQECFTFGKTVGEKLC